MATPTDNSTSKDSSMDVSSTTKELRSLLSKQLGGLSAELKHISGGVTQGNGEIVTCIPKGGLHEFVANTLPLKAEFDVITYYPESEVICLYQGPDNMVQLPTANFGLTTDDIWTPAEMSTYSGDVLFKRGLAKLAVAAISYKINHLLNTGPKSRVRFQADIRPQVLKLMARRKNVLNYVRARNKDGKKGALSPSQFSKKDMLMRIVAAVYNEFLIDLPHPNPAYVASDSDWVKKQCLLIAACYEHDADIFNALLRNKSDDKAVATHKQLKNGAHKVDEKVPSCSTIFDEIVFSGSMPMLRDYINSYCVFTTLNPLELEWSDFLKMDIQNEIVVTIIKNMPYYFLVAADVTLRGIAQVYLCNHPISGLFFSIGLIITNPQLWVYAVVGCISETVTSWVVCKESWDNIQSGLCGYDGTLVGCAVYTFVSLQQPASVHPNLVNNGLLIVWLLASASGIVRSAFSNMSKLPALTAAFNLVSLCFFFAVARGTSDAAHLQWYTPYDTPSSSTNTENDSSSDEGFEHMTGLYFYESTVLGVGQFMFVSDTLGALFVIFGIILCSRKAALMAILGSIVGTFASRYVMIIPSAAHSALRNGLYSYNSMGTAVAVAGDVFFEFNFGSMCVGVIGSMLCSFVSLGVQSLLNTDQLSLPVLTVPFILTTWIMMLTRSEWLIPTVANDVDLDDAMFMDRRHGGDIDWLKYQMNLRMNGQLNNETMTHETYESPFHRSADRSGTHSGDEEEISLLCAESDSADEMFEASRKSDRFQKFKKKMYEKVDDGAWFRRKSKFVANSTPDEDDIEMGSEISRSFQSTGYGTNDT